MCMHEAVAEGNSLLEARPATMLESLDKYKDYNHATKHNVIHHWCALIESMLVQTINYTSLTYYIACFVTLKW